MSQPHSGQLEAGGGIRFDTGADAGRGTGSPPSRPQGLRIAFIGGRGVGGTYSGIETFYEEVGERLAARGHEVTVYCRPHFTPRCRSFRGMRVRIVPALRSKHFETLVHSALSTGDALRRHFDIVHYHAIGSSVLSWVPRLIGMRTIVTVHALDWQRPKWNAVARSCLRLAEWCSVQLPDMTTAVSAAVAEHLHNAHGSEVHIIRNGVTARPTIEASQALPGQLVARRYVLFAGRLSAEKRCDDLIEAFQRLNLQDMTLAIAGGESYDPGHVARLRSLAGPSVQFLGWVDQADLASLYRHCALFVLPSSMEGLPVALLEAMAHGAPALVSNIQPNKEALGQAGRYFEMGKVSSLEEEMGRLLGNPELRRSLGEQGKQRAALQFGWEAAVDSYERLYLRLMGRNRR